MRQLDLIAVSPTLPPDVAARLEEPDSSGGQHVHTAARLAQHRPDDYARVVGLLAEGIPPHRIARALRVGVGTVYAIRRRERAEVDATKKVLAADTLDAADETLVAYRQAIRDPERVGRASIRDLAIGYGVMVDKACALEAEATPPYDPTGGGGGGHAALLREVAAMGVAAVIGVQMGAAAARSVAAAERADGHGRQAGEGAGPGGEAGETVVEEDDGRAVGAGGDA